MRKFFFNILLYISLIFLVVYLYRYNYVDIKGISFNIPLLIVSTIFLWLGFLLSSLGWHRALAVHGINISRKEAVISHGMSVFSKFIPGKIWVILGRASKVSLNKHSMETASFASLKEQLVYLWLGLLQSIILVAGPMRSMGSVSLLAALLVGLSAFIFSDWFRRLTSHLYFKILKKELSIPPIAKGEILKLLATISLYWICWDIAFLLFVKSIFPEAPAITAFIFPMSVTMGVLALFTPGGLGVREGLITLGLVSLGLPLEIAAAASIAARLWFTTGELFIFTFAFLLNLKQKFNRKRAKALVEK